MGKTTKGTQAASSGQVQQVPPNTPVSAGGGSGEGGSGGTTPQNRPGPAPTGPTPLVGEPEFLPQYTFISQGAATDSFINNAIQYHDNAGLNPRSVGSIEEILELLNDNTITGTGVLDRIRLVSHFYDPPSGTPLLSTLKIKFFRNGERGCLKEYFEGFANSSIEGLRAFVRFEMAGSPNQISIFRAPYTNIISYLSSHGEAATVNNVFSSSQHQSEKEEFVILAAGLWMLRHNIPNYSIAGLTASLETAYNHLLADLKTKITDVTAANMDNLKAKILSQPAVSFAFVTGNHATPQIYATNLAAANAAFLDNNFRNKLLAILPRFDRYSTIDIRGCQVGLNMDYMRAIQTFFGRSASVRPVVTGPDLFQYYNALSLIHPFATTPQALVAGVNGIYNSGASPFSAAEVQTQFNIWADGFGITQQHITFWNNTFQMHPLTFCAMQWKSTIPAARVIFSRLQALGSATISNIFDLLGRIFLIRTQDRPTNAQLTALSGHTSHFLNWYNTLNTAVSSSANFANVFNDFKTIYQALEDRMGNGAFNSSPQRIVPDTIPNPFANSEAEAMRVALNNFILTNSHSRLAPVVRFLNAARTLTNDAPAKFRYFLSLGGIVQLDKNSTPGMAVHALLLIDDRLSPPDQNSHHEAIRHWVRSNWRGVNPPAIPATMTFEQGRHGSWLNVNHDQGQANVCPNPNYIAHIVTLPA